MNHDSYSPDYIRTILQEVKTIALVGASANTVRPSYFVLKYLLDKGYEVHPVNPGLAGQELLGRKVYGSLAEIPGPVDMVDIFRNSDAAAEIVDEALALPVKPKVIWMQLQVRNDAAAAKAEAAGLRVVMNRCPKMEYGKLSGDGAGSAAMRVSSRRVASSFTKVAGCKVSDSGRKATRTRRGTEHDCHDDDSPGAEIQFRCHRPALDHRHSDDLYARPRRRPDQVPRGETLSLYGPTLHASLGILILALSVFRIVWRLVNTVPPAAHACLAGQGLSRPAWHALPADAGHSAVRLLCTGLLWRRTP